MRRALLTTAAAPLQRRRAAASPRPARRPPKPAACYGSRPRVLWRRARFKPTAGPSTAPAPARRRVSTNVWPPRWPPSPPKEARQDTADTTRTHIFISKDIETPVLLSAVPVPLAWRRAALYELAALGALVGVFGRLKGPRRAAGQQLLLVFCCDGRVLEVDDCGKGRRWRRRWRRKGGGGGAAALTSVTACWRDAGADKPLVDFNAGAAARASVRRAAGKVAVTVVIVIEAIFVRKDEKLQLRVAKSRRPSTEAGAILALLIEKVHF
jgi:hypothetical protein